MKATHKLSKKESPKEIKLCLLIKKSKKGIEEKFDNTEKVMTIGEIFYWIARSVAKLLN